MVGTLRQNRLVGVPLLNKKDATKDMSRGEMDTAWSENVCVCVWRDSKPVYVSSNFSGPEPCGTCQRFAGQGKGYATIPCPKMILDYNSSMGGGGGSLEPECQELCYLPQAPQVVLGHLHVVSECADGPGLETV